MAKRKKSKKAAAKPAPAKPAAPSSLAQAFEQNPHWVALGVFIVLVAIFFQEVIFGGKIFFSPDFQAPAALSAPLQNALWHKGIFPLWTPHIFAGMPSFASLIYTPFSYFPYIILMLLDRAVSLPPMLWHVLHYPIAGLGVYLYLRDRDVELVPALLGGVAFMFTPYLITMEVFGHGSQMMTAVYMPLGLWALDRLLHGRGWLYVGIAALVLGLQFQRGHVQIVYYSWLLYGVYLLYYVVRALRAKAGREIPLMLGKFVAVFVLALGMSAMLYASIYEYMPYSIRGATSALSAATAEKGVGFEYATQWSFSFGEMMTFLIPSFYGFGGQTYWGTMPFTDYPNYMGILVLLLAIFAVVYRRQAPVGFFAGIIVFALLLSFGKHLAFFYKLFYNILPLFNRFRVPVMVLVVVQMSVAILAGIGLQRLLQILRNATKEDMRQKTAKRLFAIAGGIIALAVILTIARDAFFGFMQGLYPDRYPPSVQLQLDRQRFGLLFTDWWLVSVWVAAALALYGLALRRYLTSTAFAVIILTITLADLWFVDYKLNKPTSSSELERYLKPDQVAQFLASDTSLYRIFPTDHFFGENRWAVQDIQSIGGYHAAKPRVYQDVLDASKLGQRYTQKYYRVVTQDNRQMLEPLSLEQVDANLRTGDQKLIDFLNVKYIITPYPVPEPGLVLRKQIQSYFRNQPVQTLVYENTRALPRATMVGAYVLFNKPVEALVFLRSGEFDPRRNVALYKKPAVQPMPDSSAAVEVLEYDLQHIRLRSHAEKPQILVLADTIYPPGWHATIDGKPTEILQANHAFRGLALPAGSHEIIFSYRSKVFTASIWVTIASTLLIAGCIFLGLKKRKRGLGSTA